MNRVIVDHIGLSSLLLIHVLVHSDCLCKFIITFFYSPAAMCYPGLNILCNQHNITCIVCLYDSDQNLFLKVLKINPLMNMAVLLTIQSNTYQGYYNVLSILCCFIITQVGTLVNHKATILLVGQSDRIGESLQRLARIGYSNVSVHT